MKEHIFLMTDDISKVSQPRGTSKTPESPPVFPKESGPDESFLGAMIITVLSLLLIGILGFFGYFGFRVWQEKKLIAETPSIDRLSVEVPVAEEKPAVEETPPATETPPAPPTIDKGTIEVKVMNGGAAKGSAGTLTDALKKAGYTKATFGNTTTDFTGVTVYYADGKNAEAELLKGDIVKTYPAVKTAPAVSTNKDTTLSPLVVVLGR